ncbi:hypothetical protein NP493_613g01035 [Ridgeia piscesae]|uniref:Uncharacterized protein n=1 Tax=Ridgeia piscesae TaxID=27915 RepID=A0AAD9NQU5_RIDPI|nr:hypothetical protein NP493_613g01035 [Ridgeia piscesae]
MTSRTWTTVAHVLAKYPLNILYGVAIKRSISCHLVEPVRSAGDVVSAFRIAWRLGHPRLARAWEIIVSQRQLCDEVVSQTPSLQMFVSCISGVCSKSIVGLEVRPVYPAVSYWAVFDRGTGVDFGYVASRLLCACPSAEVKPIKSMQRQADESLAPECGPLFVALKDHNGSFVIQKINDSLSSVGAVTASSPNAQLVVLPGSKYLHQMRESVTALGAAGLRIKLDIPTGF